MSAVGGTGFENKHWGPQDILYIRMLEMTKTALALNPNNKAVAFLWHQGEAETYGPTYDMHINNLQILVDGTRSCAGEKKLPFIAGDFVKDWYFKNEESCKPIVAAIRDFCADIKYAAFVETDGLKSNDEQIGDGDDIHFSRAALYVLGQRYFDAFCKIVSSE